MGATEDLHLMQDVAKRRTKEMFQDRWTIDPKFVAFCRRLNCVASDVVISDHANQAGFEIPRIRREIRREDAIPLAVFITPDARTYLILSDGKNADPIVMDREGNRRVLGDLVMHTHASDYTIEIMVRQWLLGY